jgi:hypothetical protein
MNQIFGARIGILAAFLVVLGSVTPASADEEATITAFSVWQAQGQAIRTGVDQATFIGALAGPLYVETEHGPLASGNILCPANVKIGLKDGSQRGGGQCTVTTRDGAKIFAEISCEGVHLIGCDGRLTLTGGTGQFAGITGGGPIVVRSDFGRITKTSGDTAAEQGRGILYLKDLRYKIPAPAQR